jgi:prolipoprotein diacylglyceryltransferase
MSWTYFRQNIAEIPQLQLGGLSWPGASLGVLLALLIFASFSHQPVIELVEALLPLAATVTVMVWLACWLDGIAYGRTASAWWAFPARDEWGELAPRVPVQLLGAGLALGLLGLVDAVTPGGQRKPRRPAGQARQVGGRPAVLWVVGFSGIMLVLSGLRADPAPAWAGLRLDAWAAVFLLGGSLVALVFFTVVQARDQR